MMRTAGARVNHGSVLVHTLRRVVAWTLGLVLLAGTGTALSVAVYPMVTGGASLAVLSGSMTPGLPVGAMAFVRPVDPTSIEPGDVITFQRAPDAPELVTHRVLSVDDTSGAPVFATKGDANEDPDSDPVPASAVRGELWFGVPHLGRFSALLHSPKGAGLLVVLVCAAIAATPGRRPTTTSGEDGGPTDRAGTGPVVPRRPDADLVDAADARTVVMAAVRDRPSLRPSLPAVPPPVPLLDRPRASAG
jgi:signal peptidase I